MSDQRLIPSSINLGRDRFRTFLVSLKAAFFRWETGVRTGPSRSRQDSWRDTANFLTMIATPVLIFGVALLAPTVASADPIVYHMERQLDLGQPVSPQTGGTGTASSTQALSAGANSRFADTVTNESVNPKDYYVGVGQSHGVKTGSLLTVLRRKPIYDTLGEKLYRDVEFPIATLRVIHAEKHVSIARVETYLPAANTPVIQPRAIMLGDRVEPKR